METFFRQIKSERRNELNQYISIYLRKDHILMKPILEDIHRKINRGQPVTFNQFKGLSKLLVKEPRFRQLQDPLDDNPLFYFRMFIKDLKDTEGNKPEEPISTLEQFMN